MSEQILLNLISALRAHGVRISPSESMDAMRAANITGFRQKDLLRDALSFALAKSENEKEIFYSCFESYFALDNSVRSEIDTFEENELEESVHASPLTKMLIPWKEADILISMRKASVDIDITSINFFTQKGLYIQRIMKSMGSGGLEKDIRSAMRSNSPSSEQYVKALEKARDRLFENVRDFVERQYSLFAKSGTEEALEKYLRRMKLSNLEERDFFLMKKIIQKMVKRLNSIHSRRKKQAKRGKLDFKKTLRKSISSQGIIFDMKFKSRKVDRPDIIVLCDVSRSVQAVSRFMLLFLYSLNEEIAKINSFVFCSNLVDVSHVFQEDDVEKALSRVESNSGLGIIYGKTDYGQVLRELKEHCINRINTKTTLIILGDARNNWGNPETPILKLIHDRSKKIIWLNPEPRSFWGIGDSEMDKYLPYCFLARECNTVSHLERVVDNVLPKNC